MLWSLLRFRATKLVVIPTRSWLPELRQGDGWAEAVLMRNSAAMVPHMMRMCMNDPLLHFEARGRVALQVLRTEVFVCGLLLK